MTSLTCNLPYQVGVGPVVFRVEEFVLTGLGAGVTLLLSTVITAFFIPNLLRKGTIDLILSRPIHPWYLLLCKYVGGMSFMFINTVVIVCGLWLVLGLRTGFWPAGFLVGVFTLTLQFAVLYVVSVLAGVLTRSATVSILATCLWWAVLFGLGHAFVFLGQVKEEEAFPRWLHTSVEAVHFILPRYRDLDILAVQAIASDVLPHESPEMQHYDAQAASVNWGESLGITFGFLALVLTLACWRFSTKEY